MVTVPEIGRGGEVISVNGEEEVTTPTKGIAETLNTDPKKKKFLEKFKEGRGEVFNIF